MNLAVVAGAAAETIQGVLLDPSGAPVAQALVKVTNAADAVLGQAQTDVEGRFQLERLPAGLFRLKAEAPGFAPRAVAVSVPRAETTQLVVRFDMAVSSTLLTVTASRSAVEEIGDAQQFANVVTREQLQAMPLPTLAAALQNAPGVMVQTTSYGQASPVLRGFTGYQTLILVDGIRFNSSIFRSGPNQYSAYVDPAQADSLEAILGPSSVAYGSDALGGTFSVLTAAPSFTHGRGHEVHGEISLQGASADLSGRAHGRVSWQNQKFWVMAGGSGRRINDVRAGGGLDSHNIFRRYFGLPLSTIKSTLGDRLQDTGFGQAGGEFKFAWRPTDTQTLTGRLQRTGFANLRQYRDTWGGLGRLISQFEPQYGQLSYVRYEKQRVGWLDSVAGTFSANTIADGNRRQATNVTDPLTFDDQRSDNYGYSAQAATHLGRRHLQLFGGELFDDHVSAYSETQNVTTGVRTQLRAILPNGSRYYVYGLFAQDSSEWFGGRLRTVVGIRHTVAQLKTYNQRNLNPQGRPLGVSDSSQRFDNWTYNAGLTWRAASWLTLHAMASRAFRAPNTTDLATLGLSGQGYEVPAASAITQGALLADSNAEGAISLGMPIQPVRAETLRNSEFGFVLRKSRTYLRVQGFYSDFFDPLSRRTLLFPANRVPAVLDGLAVSPIPPTNAQRAQGVVTVATTLDPRAVKAFVNDGQAVYYGTEVNFRFEPTRRWSVESGYSWLNGRTLYPNRFARRLPPQQAMARLRYSPTRRLWVDVSGIASGHQDRMPPGDLDDERVGASRRRADIATIFNGGLVAPYRNGAIFTPTGETLRQIQDRVLPLGASINGVTIVNDQSRVPMLLRTAGWFTTNVQLGFSWTDNLQVTGGVMNLLDRNMRVHGSGVDMPGINAFVGLHWRF
ncbi:MAG: TonB-dependent receptor [Acidobacteria bacterium]|nr:TonB-dependent receptor [Acidobacteriota bacterium]